MTTVTWPADPPTRMHPRTLVTSILPRARHQALGKTQTTGALPADAARSRLEVTDLGGESPALPPGKRKPAQDAAATLMARDAPSETCQAAGGLPVPSRSGFVSPPPASVERIFGSLSPAPTGVPPRLPKAVPTAGAPAKETRAAAPAMKHSGERFKRLRVWSKVGSVERPRLFGGGAPHLKPSSRRARRTLPSTPSLPSSTCYAS